MLPVHVRVEPLREPLKHVCFCFLAETPTWQLDQGEEEEEANEGQQRSQGPPDGLRSLHERQTGAATGRASRRALSRDYKDAGQRVEQAAPRGEAGQQRSLRQDYTVSPQWWRDMCQNISVGISFPVVCESVLRLPAKGFKNKSLCFHSRPTMECSF